MYVKEKHTYFGQTGLSFNGECEGKEAVGKYGVGLIYKVFSLFLCLGIGGHKVIWYYYWRKYSNFRFRKY